MALHRQKEDVLLAWINSLRLANPVNNIILLQDGILLLKLICKLKGQEVQGLLDQPIQKRLEFVSDFLRTAHCRYKADRGAIISWDNILNRKDLDIELSKVVVLLMCHAIVNELLITDELDHKTEIQMAAVLRFVLDNENSLHLSDNLEKFLQKPFTVCLPSDSSTSSFSDESPVLSRIRRPEVKFLELMTVASSSAGSPIQEVLNTPQFQLRKVRKQLAEERDMRDELERELANTSQLVAERELQISQLQHRLQRLMRDNAEQDQEPKALEELQNKNEGLLKHLHEVLKQCQDLKTNKGQMEKKIDQLTEENGDLSVNIKDMVARLSSAQTMVDTLSEEQQASQAEWESKKMFFETELCQAVSEKESLSEQIQILRGKISILEDELRKAHAQTQERGEVMGPIMEWERLNQEISELTCKLLQLQETILQLEKEKGEMQAKHEMEKNKFESEVSHLQGLISELQHTLCVLRGEREALEQISREQQATMTSQISAMNAEIARLSDVIHQKELAATVFSQQVAEEQKQKEILMQNMEKQDQINQETVQGLSEQVKHLETTLKSKEEESSRQQAFLQEASESAIQERDTILVEYHQFRQAKEEEVLDLNKQVRQLEEQREVERSLLSDLRREKEELHLKLISLESAIRDLQNELEVESRKHRETLAAKLQKHSQMESEITELGHRVQQLLTDIKLMGQQLNEAQQEKRHAESCVEELKIECRELSNALSAERDHSLHLAKERAAEVEMLSANVQTKTEEVEKLAKETEQYLVELEATRTAKSTVESHLNSVIEKHQAEICTLHLELTDVQGLVKQKEAEKELLQDEISTKEEEVKIQQERVLYLQSETAQMEELRQNLAEEEKRHQMTKQDADARMAEVQLLRVSLDEKEDKISTLLQSIQALEEKACALQDVQNKESEDYKHSVSELEQRVAESQAQICKKVTAFETQSQLVLSLQKDLALEQARAVSLEENLKALESALRTQKVQEKELREESIVHREELNRQKADLEKLHQEILLIQEEKREAESREVIATEKITILQAEVLSVSSLATERNESLEHMKKKFAAVSIELNCLKEQDIERNKLAAADCKRQEEAIHKLHRDLLSASSLSSERDQEIQMLQTKVSSLKKELEIQEEMQCLRDQETNAMRSKCRELEEKITQLEAQVLEASTLASGKELELCTLRSEFTERENLRLNAAETEAAQRRELEEKVAQLQAQVQEASTLASGKESELCTLRSELKERETLRLKAAETEAAQRRELEEKVSQLEAQVLKASTLASGKESELCTLRSELKERENLRLNAAETEAAQRRELEEKVSQLEAQVLEASTLASGKELELCTLRSELKERENLRLNAAETEAAQRRELEEKVAQLLEASTLASGKELELCTLRSELKERENLRLNAAETEAAQRRELEEKVSQLEAQVLEASTLASGKELELCTLRSELKERENLRLNAAETEAAQRRELEEKVSQLEAQLLEASTNVSLRESELSSLHKGMEEIIANLKAKLLSASTQEENATKLQQQIAALRHTNEELLLIREGLQKEQEVSQKLTEDLATQLQLAREELSTLRPLRGEMAERSQLNTDLQEQLSLKSEALEHYKAQVENAKIHYNGKKQQLLEANEKIQALTTALETNEQEIKTLTEQIQVLQLELEQARATEKNFLFNINSLQAQLDYADKQLREQKRLGKCEELKPKETVYQKVTEKQQDTSGDSLDLSLEDSLNSTRRPSKREESSTPVLRSSERLQAKQRARGGESLETLYFTPMSVRNAVDGKLESSITSLGELVLDSAKRSHSARRRTTQVINITMTKKTPGRVEADPEDGFTSALSLQSAQSFPNLANQRCRPFSLEFSEEATASDQLRHLPGYRRSAAHSAAPPRSISTFRVGAENEPDHSEDWMRIAELQARNQACLPHLKSSYPIESRPSLGNPSFTITDDDLKMGDPNETIRRASMMPSQITDSLASHRLSMLPGQIHDAPLSRRETMLPGDIGSRAASQHAALHPKRCASNAQNTRAATLPLKRGGCDLPGPDTPETKKLASCFPRPMTPKDRNDRRFALQNSQNRPPNTPVERRQSMMFSIENTPKKNGKSFLQKGINKMRASTRKSPGSTSKIPRSAKSPRGEKPQRRSPRINSNKSPKITSSARKNVSAQFMECVFVQREDMALETEQQPR
ncbi:nuclear mitotic apparatus protein 1 isoform X15 [Anguilla anguilla]|uniref:nuclear mitotic apparatus protein 1 isoform X15 n=1 Tax=Anguilla anguilla TaxID=7936 RepID=UPI0015A7D98F|nr:nuclear mitotic apparatus protein 1 isoform X15 [Anguilla anguilla]